MFTNTWERLVRFGEKTSQSNYRLKITDQYTEWSQRDLTQLWLKAFVCETSRQCLILWFVYAQKSIIGQLSFVCLYVCPHLTLPVTLYLYFTLVMFIRVFGVHAPLVNHMVKHGEVICLTTSNGFCFPVLLVSLKYVRYGQKTEY